MGARRGAVRAAATNAIHWHIPNAYNVWEHASPEHAERWLRPPLRGEIRDAYAVTERDAGSDPSRIEATAVPSATAAGCSTARSGS